MRRYQSDWIPIGEVCSGFVALGCDEQAAKEDIIAAWKDGKLTVRVWLSEPDGSESQYAGRPIDLGRLTVNSGIKWSASKFQLPLTNGKYIPARCEAARWSVVALLETLGSAPQVTQAKRGGGRPVQKDWDAFWCELCWYISEEGQLPKTQAELVREMQQWWQDNYQDEPVESEIEKRISQLFRRFQRT